MIRTVDDAREVLRFLDEDLQKAPGDKFLWVKKGDIHARIKEMSQAKQAYEKAQAIDSHDFTVTMKLQPIIVTGHLLLIHSLLDDNVHPQHTMQLLTALTEAGKDVDFRLYPPGRHGAAYDAASRLLIMRTEDAFLARWLKADGGLPPVALTR